MVTPNGVPRRRLGSLNNPSIGRKPQKKKTAAPRPTVEEIKCCDSPKIEDEDGHKVCKNCFTEISENNIVSDVTFEEDSRGAHTVQGGFIGDNARHAKTLGVAARRLGGDQRNSLQEIEANGRRALNGIVPRLGIPETVANQAAQLFIIASQNRFSSGRKTEEVAAACLYAACRRQKENTVMLIDIAELIQVNVFRLGEVYKDMCSKLYLEESGSVGASGVGRQYLVEVEYLVMKYCRKLEFGEATRQVAEDAIKILKRMKRDWMVTGRHPAGLCGACIILAARMNNFRRTTREVVLVAKVADVTLAKRVEEFRRTKSAALTVEQFREYGVRLKHQNDPPVLYESELRKAKLEEKKRKRQTENEERERSASATPAPSEATDNPTSTSEQGDVVGDEARRKRAKNNSALPTPPSTQESSQSSQVASTPDSQASQATSQSATTGEPGPRYDADGFAIPALPTAPTEDQTNNDKPGKRGRGKKQAPTPIVITDEELATEAELQREIVEVLDDEHIIESSDEVEQARREQRAKETAERQIQLAADANQTRRESEGIDWWDSQQTGSSEIITEEDLEKEFANDPEVVNCLLSPAEQQVKERIWVTFNEDWLRVQHEKKLLAEVAKAHPPPASRRGAKGGKRKKKGRMGDGTTLAEASTPIQSPADASQAMLEKRANKTYSKQLNYDILNALYGKRRGGSSSRASSEMPDGDAASSRAVSESPAPSERGGSPAAAETDAAAGPSRKSAVKKGSEEAQVEEIVEEEGGQETYGDNADYNEDDMNNYDSDNEGDERRGWFGNGDDEDMDGEDDGDDYGRVVSMASRQTENFGNEFGEYDDDGY